MLKSGLLFQESGEFFPSLGRIFSHRFPLVLFTFVISQNLDWCFSILHLWGCSTSRDEMWFTWAGALGTLPGLRRAGWADGHENWTDKARETEPLGWEGDSGNTRGGFKRHFAARIELTGLWTGCGSKDREKLMMTTKFLTWARQWTVHESSFTTKI